MRPADSNPSPYKPLPLSRIAGGKPERSISAARSTLRLEGNEGLINAGSAAIPPPSPHETSAGTISVAIWPGAARDATIALADSRPASEEACEVRSHFE